MTVDFFSTFVHFEILRKNKKKTKVSLAVGQFFFEKKTPTKSNRIKLDSKTIIKQLTKQRGEIIEYLSKRFCFCQIW